LVEHGTKRDGQNFEHRKLDAIGSMVIEPSGLARACRLLSESLGFVCTTNYKWREAPELRRMGGAAKGFDAAYQRWTGHGGFRKLSARPRHHAQNPQAAADFEKGFPPSWTRSRPSSLASVEFATLEWVDWFNNRRRLEPIGKIPAPKPEPKPKPKPKRAIMRNSRSTQWRRDSNQTASGKPGAVHLLFSCGG
jgi:hypothetical protein